MNLYEHRETLARAVRDRRKRLGLRQTDLAVLAGCSPQWLGKLESGRHGVHLDKVVDVLDALGLHLEVTPGRGGITATDDVG